MTTASFDRKKNVKDFSNQNVKAAHGLLLKLMKKNHNFDREESEMNEDTDYFQLVML